MTRQFVWTRKVVGLLALLVMTSALPARAANDGPAGQAGVGIDVGGMYNGLHGVYALDKNIQVGAHLGMGLMSASGFSVSGLMFAPYARYQLGPVVGDLVPFGQLQFAVFGGGYYGYLSTTVSALSFSGGLTYNVSPSFVVSGRVELVQLFFSGGTAVSLGVMTPTLSAEWFF